MNAQLEAAQLEHAETCERDGANGDPKKACTCGIGNDAPSFSARRNRGADEKYPPNLTGLGIGHSVEAKRVSIFRVERGVEVWREEFDVDNAEVIARGILEECERVRKGTL